jgi:putative endonuclease
MAVRARTGSTRAMPAAGTRTARQRTGSAAEARAATHIVAAGLEVIARNWRCRAGELDIVAREPGRGSGPDALVFVEVRARATAAYGGAGASITAAKQRRIATAAQLWCQVNGRTDLPCRFDVVLIEAGELEWIRDAFRPGG